MKCLDVMKTNPNVTLSQEEFSEKLNTKMISNYQLRLSRESLLDDREAVNRYNMQQENLGERFQSELNINLNPDTV